MTMTQKQADRIMTALTDAAGGYEFETTCMGMLEWNHIGSVDVTFGLLEKFYENMCATEGDSDD